MAIRRGRCHRGFHWGTVEKSSSLMMTVSGSLGPRLANGAGGGLFSYSLARLKISRRSIPQTTICCNAPVCLSLSSSGSNRSMQHQCKWQLFTGVPLHYNHDATECPNSRAAPVLSLSTAHSQHVHRYLAGGGAATVMP